MSDENRPTAADSGTGVRAAGDRAWLVTAPVRPFVAALRSRQVPGITDILPAAETVLVTVDSVREAEPVRRRLQAVLAEIGCAAVTEGRTSVEVGERPGTVRNGRRATRAGGRLTSDEERPSSAEVGGRPAAVVGGRPAAVVGGQPAAEAEPLRIPVRYDGPDLEEVATLLGITPEAVVRAHTSTVWRCAFVGFAPGFGYLESPDGRLSVPRRDSPRTAVPVGAVALAGGYCAVYPRATPGGWRIIGRTELAMWDVERDPPALIGPDVAVRFEAVAS